MVETTLYSYDPIQRDQLRMVKFIEDGAHLSAVLKTFSVEEPVPPYRALTYTWTTNEPVTARSWAIQIEKQRLPVLDSLRPFVDALRSKGVLLDDQWWWIDSICIDQTNLAERAQQVQLMQYTYCLADSVVVWLGEESSDSNLAIDFIILLDEIAQQNRSLDEIRAALQRDEYRLQWTALTNFLARKWWSRIWTVQEFVLPATASFWCGGRDVSRAAVCHSISMADKCTSMGVKQTLGFTHANNRRRAWNLYKAGKNPGVNLSLSLLALAAYFCCMDATDDRDRLYGLMALSTDGALLDTNYFLSTQEVYLGFTQAFIQRHKSLDIICFASIYSAPSGSSLPSWVPDWQKKNPQVIPLMVSQSSRTHVGNLRTPTALQVDPSIYYSASKDRVAVYELVGSELHARGVIVDTVDGLAGSSRFGLVQSSEWNSGQLPGCSDPVRTCSPTDILASVCRSLVLDRKDRYLRWAMPEAEFFRDFVSLLALLGTGLHSSAPKELQEWFGWTRSLQIHGRSFEDILRDGMQAGIDDSPGSAPNQDEYYHDTFFGRFFDTVIRLSLRLMISRNGHIGMVSEKAMKGDVICVLFGCSVPVLLRKSEDGDSFTFVGECFLDGCMDGSVLEQNELVERVFRIR